MSRELRRSRVVVHGAMRSRGVLYPMGSTRVTRLRYPQECLDPAPGETPPDGEILFVGKNRPEKGLRPLLDALDRLRAVPQLRIVGRQGDDGVAMTTPGASQHRTAGIDRGQVVATSG